MIAAIVTADKNWAIGKLGRQVTTIPDDVRYIRSATAGKTVIMGRKTYESYIQAQVPTNRNNIILSRNPEFKAPGCIVCTSVESALAKAGELGVDVYVLGGGQVYREMLQYLDELEVTAVDYSYDADTYFPDISGMPEWVLVEESEEQTHFDTVYYLRKYLRRKDYKC